MNNLVFRIGLLFFCIGLFFLIFCGYCARENILFNNVAKKTTGEVVQNTPSEYRSSNGTRSVVYYSAFKYKVDEKTFYLKSNVASYPPQFEIGEIVNILFDPSDPKNAKVDDVLDVWFTTAIFAILGVIFSSIGGGILGYRIFKAQRKAWLTTHGHPVQAKISEIYQKKNVIINGKSPWIIEAQWLSPEGKMYLFESDYFEFKPHDLISGTTELTVMIDPKNPKKYYMKLPDILIKAAA